MDKEIQYNRNFSLLTAYQFLENNGLKEESEKIRITPAQFKTYTSTLRRAKVIALVNSENIIDKFNTLRSLPQFLNVFLVFKKEQTEADR
ncbi:MAG: hypothetical protein ABFR82_06985 [Nitrospirota bacterium]